MVRLLLWIAVLCVAAGAQAQPSGQRFVSIAFHDVDDKVGELETDAVTTQVLARFFDWLKGSGWTAITLDDIAAANRGTRPLPDKAILISFDDGYSSLYTRVFPLLKVYNFPIVSALVGTWMEGRPDGTVLYGDRVVPRSEFITWAQAREMQASGLVEFASHSWNLHRGILANPQGNMTPAAITWRYDEATRTYETDAQYRARIRDDLARSRQQIAANLGRAPRAVVWPFGRFTGPAVEIARGLGYGFALTLEPEPAYTSELYAIHRYFPARNPTLGDLSRNLRFEPGRPTTRRVACLSIDSLAALPIGAAQDEALGRMIEGLRVLGANTAIIDAAPAASDGKLSDLYFSTPLLPLRADVLARASWQIRTRGGADVFLRLPIAAAAAAVGETNVPALFADMMRRATPDGIAIDVAEKLPAAPAADLVGNIRAARARLDPATLGRICPHPCESGCNRAGKDGAVAINALERFLGDWGLQHRLQLPTLDAGERGESIGVIGAAPRPSRAPPARCRPAPPARRCCGRCSARPGAATAGIPAPRDPRSAPPCPVRPVPARASRPRSGSRPCAARRDAAR